MNGGYLQLAESAVLPANEATWVVVSERSAEPRTDPALTPL